MPDPLEAAFGLGDGPVELRHLLSVAAVSAGSDDNRLLPSMARKSEVIVVEVAERARVRQPNLGNVGREPVEVAQPPDAEQAEHDDQQKEEQEHRGEVKPDRMRLPHEASTVGESTRPMAATIRHITMHTSREDRD